MASKEPDSRFRIPVALVVIGLAVTSLLMIWRPEIELWFKIGGSLLCAILLTWATMILIGKTKSGGRLLTRRRWKQFTVLGVVAAAAITLGVIISILAALPESRSPLVPALYPMLLGLAAAYLYEPESPPLIRPPATDRDARAWKRNAFVIAIAGIGLGCIAVIAAAAGNTFVRILFEGPAVVLLITAAVMGTMLRTRNRRRANP